MRIAVIQHALAEGPGEIAQWATLRGHSLTTHLSFAAAPLPRPDAFDLLTIMGGEMNAYQDRDFPWLRQERAAIATAADAGKPLLGICLGAQLIADLFGQRVTQNLEYELGWLPINLTDEARARMPKLPASATVLHWHGDTYSLPAGAVRLATSAGSPEQGFLIPGRCLALQFHLEVQPAMLPGMMGDVAYWPSGRFVQSPEMLLQEAKRHAAATPPLLYELLDHFVAGIEAPP